MHFIDVLRIRQTLTRRPFHQDRRQRVLIQLSPNRNQNKKRNDEPLDQPVEPADSSAEPTYVNPAESANYNAERDHHPVVAGERWKQLAEPLIGEAEDKESGDGGYWNGRQNRDHHPGGM